MTDFLQALTHPWFGGNGMITPEPSFRGGLSGFGNRSYGSLGDSHLEQSMRGIKSYVKERQLRKAVILLLVVFLDDREVSTKRQRTKR